MCTMWTVPLRHASSDTTAVKPAPLMGGRGGSAVDIVVVAPGTSSAVVGRVLIGIVQATDFGDCLFIGIVRTIDFGDCLLIGIVQIIDFGDCLLIGIVQTIDFCDCL